ncbi:hypothetical protein KE480_06585 [Enterococcus sp. 079]|nr:hypothetical protein [Enterococcus sp. 079]
MNGQFTLNNYLSYFTSGTSLSMTINSVWYAFLITFFTLIISYPTAYFFNKTEAQAIMADADYFAYMGESAA